MNVAHVHGRPGFDDYLPPSTNERRNRFSNLMRKYLELMLAIHYCEKWFRANKKWPSSRYQKTTPELPMILEAYLPPLSPRAERRPYFQNAIVPMGPTSTTCPAGTSWHSIDICDRRRVIQTGAIMFIDQLTIGRNCYSQNTTGCHMAAGGCEELRVGASHQFIDWLDVVAGLRPCVAGVVALHGQPHAT